MHASAPPPPLYPGDILAGRYRILDVIGAGGFGQLFRAEQTALGRTVAVKVVLPQLARDPAALERFRLEARAACRLSHPSLVVYHDFGEDEYGRLFLVMEYIAGRTLADILADTPVLPTGRAVALMTQVCDALQEAHDAGIIHRDLKPANVMVLPGDPRAGRGEQAKVIDFGILKLTRGLPGEQATEPLDAPHTITGTDELVGTPGYLAPEVVREDPFDDRIDQYAVGVMLHEMLAGRRPFDGADAWAVFDAQATTAPPPLTGARADLPRRVSDAVGRALATHPDERFSDMATLAGTLRRATHGWEDGPQADATRSVPQRSLSGTVDATENGGGEAATVIDFSVPDDPLHDLDTEAPTPRTRRVAGPSPPQSSQHPKRRFVAVGLVAAIAVAVALGVAAALWWPGNDAPTPDVVAPTAPDSRAGVPGSDAGRSTPTAPVPSPTPSAGNPEPRADVRENLDGQRADVDTPADAGSAGTAPAATAAPRKTARRTPRRAKDRRPARTAAEERQPRPEPKPTGEGLLDVNARPFARIRVGSRALGPTPVIGARLPAGRHTVVATHPSMGEKNKSVTVEANGRARVTFTFP